jgi:hypothetical protein
MKMYWVKFVEEESHMLFRTGCGITALSEDDALKVIRLSPALDGFYEKILSIEHIKFEDIEKKHILPNAGNYAVRGIWYPHGV